MKSMVCVDTKSARDDFASILDSVTLEDKTVGIERSDNIVAVVIPGESFGRLLERAGMRVKAHPFPRGLEIVEKEVGPNAAN